MNIRIITTDKKIKEVKSHGKMISELSARVSSNDYLYDLEMFDPQENTITPVESDIPAQDWIPVCNCIWESEDFFYAYVNNSDEDSKVSLFRYKTSDGTRTEIFSFNKDPDPFDDMRFRLFVLSEDQVIVQAERHKLQDTDQLMGNIEFNQTLHDLNTGETNTIKDVNLINNGISIIIPVSPADIMMKTGFSSILDSRITAGRESEALIESVYFGSMAMFISSAFRDKTTIGYKLLGTAYNDKGIIDPGARDDYIYFTILDYENMSAETIFYDHVTDETLRCLNENANSEELCFSHVINNVPYIRSNSAGSTMFFNVRASENDSVFFNENFQAVVGNLFVFDSAARSKHRIRVYDSPKNKLLLETSGKYVAGCQSDSDYYIYISSK